MKKAEKIELNKEAKEVLLSKAEQKEEKFNSISTYNGDICDLYNWSQGTNEVQIQFKLHQIPEQRNLLLILKLQR